MKDGAAPIGDNQEESKDAAVEESKEEAFKELTGE